MTRHPHALLTTLALAVAALIAQGCASVQTFPRTARAGDTVAFMIGGSAKARTDSVDVTLTDANGQDWDLQAQGLVRSVFSVRMDARAQARHYGTFSEQQIAWVNDHEPLQTVLVTDLPGSLPTGNATLTVNPNVNDDQSGVSKPLEIDLDIVAGQGSPDPFEYETGFGKETLDFARLEPAAYARIMLDNAGAEVGAASFVIDFDETVVEPGDLNVTWPETHIRSSDDDPSFEDNQRMTFWRQDGDRLYIDVVAPRAIDGQYVIFYIMQPPAVQADPQFTVVSADIYDVDGNPLSVGTVLDYFPR